MEAPSAKKLGEFPCHPLELEPQSAKAKTAELLQHFKALTADPRWTTFEAPEGIEAKMLDQKDGLIPVQYARSTVACTPAELFRYLVTDITETHKDWNDVMYHSATLKEITKTERILTIISDGTPIRDREDVCFASSVEDNGDFYELSVGMLDDVVPLNPNGAARRFVCGKPWVLREHLHFAAKYMRAVEGGCEYVTMWQDDPLGWTTYLLGKQKLADICMKNLIHEHEKVRERYDPKGKVCKDHTTAETIRAFAPLLGMIIVALSSFFYLLS
jgi:hypothetical protein